MTPVAQKTETKLLEKEKFEGHSHLFFTIKLEDDSFVSRNISKPALPMTSKTRNKCVQCTVYKPFGYQGIWLLFLVTYLAQLRSSLRTVCHCVSVDTVPVALWEMF